MKTGRLFILCCQRRSNPARHVCEMNEPVRLLLIDEQRVFVSGSQPVGLWNFFVSTFAIRLERRLG
jgi:hypothetical protein